MSTKSVRLLVLLVVLTLGIGLACNFTGAAQPFATTEPTAVPPTDTPVPTDTPIPPTETPVPTPTPDAQATRSAEATAIAEAMKAEIDAELARVDLEAGQGYLGYVQTEPEIIEMQTYGDAFFYEFAEGLSVSDFILKTDITWESDGLVVCGIIMRSGLDFVNDPQYIFQYLRFSGLPAWDIEFWDNSEYVMNITQRVRFSDALLMENGAKNTFILQVEGEDFTVFINGKRQGHFVDYGNKAPEGYFAFIGMQDSGPSTCMFENTWVWVTEE